MNLSLLVHTFNKYEKYWDGCLSGWDPIIKDDDLQENIWGHRDIDKMYFGTDVPWRDTHDFRRFHVLYSGEGEWSDRLINLLHQIPTDYVLYIQEDMWPCAQPPNLAELLHHVEQNDIYRLQISPVVQFYSLTGDKIPLFFHWKSKYLVSHQPSIWKKSFLLECLKPNEDPWKNEYEGTKRLNIPEMQGKIAIYPHHWFSHESVSGKKLVDSSQNSPTARVGT